MTEWWRLVGWPTASEWQALWACVAAILAGVLLYIAWKQLHGLSESNRSLAESNKLLAESNHALSRPTVVVEFEFERTAWRNFTNSNNESTVFVVVRNVGASPALDVKLKVSPGFESTGQKLTDEGIAALNRLFSGEAPIRMIAPGQKLTYILDSAKDALNDASLPPEYSVTADYTDTERERTYSEHFFLQMAPWAMSVAQVDSAKQISKDLQFISENLRSTERGIPAVLAKLRAIAQNLEPAPGAQRTSVRTRVRALRGSRRRPSS